MILTKFGCIKRDTFIGFFLIIKGRWKLLKRGQNIRPLAGFGTHMICKIYKAVYCDIGNEFKMYLESETINSLLKYIEEINENKFISDSVRKFQGEA